MLAAGLDLLACPRCGGPLTADGQVTCPAGHAFDVARQGYLNLGGRSAPRNADTAEMVAARTTFLTGGHYDPIVRAVGALTPPIRRLVDAGAGTGYYAARLLDARPDLRGLALDVSVPAIRRAARAHDRLAAAVTDVWRPLPVRDAVADLVLSVFAPRNPGEFARILRPGGLLVTVTPQPTHLGELRDELGLIEHHGGKADRLAHALTGAFRAGPSTVVTERQLWDAATARSSVLMGPNAFHLPSDQLDGRLSRLSWPRRVTVAVRVDSWAPVLPEDRT